MRPLLRMGWVVTFVTGLAMLVGSLVPRVLAGEPVWELTVFEPAEPAEVQHYDSQSYYPVRVTDEGLVFVDCDAELVVCDDEGA